MGAMTAAGMTTTAMARASTMTAQAMAVATGAAVSMATATTGTDTPMTLGHARRPLVPHAQGNSWGGVQRIA